MTRPKQATPKFPIEYRVLITPVWQDREKITVTRVAIRTVNEFTNFRYEIVVKPVLEGRSLRLNINGLRAPQVTIPGTGPALFSVEYRDLRGDYDVTVNKLNRVENTFGITVSESLVTVTRSPRTRFVEIVTSEDEW